uniref:Uncharacterized protein n=1 Tax=Arundo donax TaxID=35708 RepID=A0A0A9F0T8_ARUDO
MEQHRRTRRRLLKGFSGLARSLVLVTAAAASCRFANDRDLPEKKLDSPLLIGSASSRASMHASVPAAAPFLLAVGVPPLSTSSPSSSSSSSDTAPMDDLSSSPSSSFTVSSTNRPCA